MRFIMEEKVYDTETSERIFSIEHTAYGFIYYQTELFRTKNDNWFLLEGDQIAHALTKEQIKEWLLAHHAPAKVIERFYIFEEG